MSNGLTVVVYASLVLSGSRIARTDSQKDVVTWLASHDQSTVGSGTVGFDLGELPLSPDDLEQDRQFLHAVIARARSGVDWPAMAPAPGRPEVLVEALDRLEQLVSALTTAHLTEPRGSWAGYESPPGYPRCAGHDALEGLYGCLIDNELGGPT